MSINSKMAKLRAKIDELKKDKDLFKEGTMLEIGWPKDSGRTDQFVDSKGKIRNEHFPILCIITNSKYELKESQRLNGIANIVNLPKPEPEVIVELYCIATREYFTYTEKDLYYWLAVGYMRLEHHV